MKLEMPYLARLCAATVGAGSLDFSFTSSVELILPVRLFDMGALLREGIYNNANSESGGIKRIISAGHVVRPGPHPPRNAADRAARLRHTDTSFRQMTDSQLF